MANLIPPKAPNLPLARPQYDPGQMGQFLNVLRIYFNTIDNTFQSLLDASQGGKFVHFPYGSFHDSTDQTAASATAAYVITFDSTDLSNGVTIESNSQITVANPGIYNLQFSTQVVNTTNDTQDIDIWFRKNGVDIADSNSRFGIPARKSTGSSSHTIAALNFFLDMAANDYVELAWCVSDTGVYLEHYPAQTSPTRPAIPSIILTMAFVSGVE